MLQSTKHRSTLDDAAGEHAATSMKKNHFELVSTIATMVEQMTEALFAKDLLTPDKRDEARITSQSDFKRATILVDCARSIVRFSPDKIYTFIAILHQLHPQKESCPVALSLEKCMNKLMVALFFFF